MDPRDLWGIPNCPQLARQCVSTDTQPWLTTSTHFQVALPQRLPRHIPPQCPGMGRRASTKGALSRSCRGAQKNRRWPQHPGTNLPEGTSPKMTVRQDISWITRGARTPSVIGLLWCRVTVWHPGVLPAHRGRLRKEAACTQDLAQPPLHHRQHFPGLHHCSRPPQERMHTMQAGLCLTPQAQGSTSNRSSTEPPCPCCMEEVLLWLQRGCHLLITMGTTGLRHNLLIQAWFQHADLTGRLCIGVPTHSPPHRRNRLLGMDMVASRHLHLFSAAPALRMVLRFPCQPSCLQPRRQRQPPLVASPFRLPLP